MTASRAGFERRVIAALDAVPSRIPVIVGGCGTGRTFLLERLRDRIGRSHCQYVDVERCVTTPERFLQAVSSGTPLQSMDAPRTPATTREAFDALLAFVDTARAPDAAPATFLLDEFLELRTFESFPGLRHVLRDLLDALAQSGNRFVLSTRYVTRALRALRDGSPRFEMMPVPALLAGDVTEVLEPAFAPGAVATEDLEYLGRAVQAITDGRAAYVCAIRDQIVAMGGRAADPISALTGLLSPDGLLANWCRFSYELRLHRARGYGALKAILDILAEDEGLTLTEISQRLHRTPGSTKDYLSWLEDVDLVTSRQKRYSYVDPLLRLWVRLHCRSSRPSSDDVVREVQRYALSRLPRLEPAAALAVAGAGGDVPQGDRKNWGIIEID